MSESSRLSPILNPASAEFGRMDAAAASASGTVGADAKSMAAGFSSVSRAVTRAEARVSALYATAEKAPPLAFGSAGGAAFGVGAGSGAAAAAGGVGAASIHPGD